MLLVEVLDIAFPTSMKWHSHFWDSGLIEKAACQNSGTVVDLTVQPIVPSD